MSSWFDSIVVPGATPAGGAYVDGAYSGLVTGVAAGSATAGHLWACRFVTPTNTVTDARRFAVIQRLRIRSFTITSYTAAQEVLLAVFKLTAYTAAHTGATAITPVKKSESYAAPLMTARIADTGALTAGTQTLSTDPIRSGAFAERAAADVVPKGAIDILLTTEDLIRDPIILGNNEGLLLRNEVAMGAAGVARIVVEMDWRETSFYP